MAHPLRLRILRLCLHEALTNKQIADRLRIDPATTLHHVRMLVNTGFLAVEPVRSGARGALEKPYRATGKSWVLSVPRASDRDVSKLAVVDALRAELAETDADDVVAFTRLGLKLTESAAAELNERIQSLVDELSTRDDDDPTATPYGFFIILHRQR